MQERCDNCHFFWSASESGDEGQCRRHGPLPLLRHEQDADKMVPLAMWPQVHAEQWCGEWHPLRGVPQCPTQTPTSS